MEYLKKGWIKLVGLFKQGLTPKQLALSIAIAILVSVFPIFGITTIVLSAIALKFKLNLPIMIVLSYVVEPLKIVLFIPFVNIGATLFGTEHTLMTFDAIKASYDADFFTTLGSLAYELLCGFAGWFVIALPVSALFYLLLKVILTFFDKFKKPTNEIN